MPSLLYLLFALIPHYTFSHYNLQHLYKAQLSIPPNSLSATSSKEQEGCLLEKSGPPHPGHLDSPFV